MKRALVAVLVLALVGAAFVVAQIGPRNLIGMLRYDQREEGRIRVGEPAPDVLLLSLDGTTRARLADLLGGQPVVLVFGSFT